MLTSEAHVETERPSRYLVQLCRHISQMGRPLGHRPRAHGGDTQSPPEVQHIEWTETYGTARLSWGQWTMQAAPGTLTLRAEAADEKDLQRIQDLVAGRLEKIGRRDHLAVAWQRSEAPSVQPDEAGEADDPHLEEGLRHTQGTTRRWSLNAIGGAAAVAVGTHLVLGGSALAASRWLGWGAGAIVLAVILVKVIGVGSLATLRGHRRGR